MAENDGGWRPTYEICWQCKKRVRADQTICVWCGATRVSQGTQNQLWTPPESSGEPSRRAQGGGVPYGGPAAQQGAFLFPQVPGVMGPYGMTPGDVAQPGNRSPLGVAVPPPDEPPDPYQVPAPAHPYEFMPPQQPQMPQTPHDWRRPPVPAPSYVPSTGPLSWDGDQSGRGKSYSASPATDDGSLLSEETLEHPQLPRQAPPMQQLGRVRLVQESHGNDQNGHRGYQGQTDMPQAYGDGPPDRGARHAPQPAPQPEQGYGYAPQPGPTYGHGYEPAYQPDYQHAYDPRYGAAQPGYGQQSGHGQQSGYDPGSGSGHSGYGYQPGYEYGYGYPSPAREEEPPPGPIQNVVDQIWDAVHAEEALAWLEAKVQGVLPYVQQFLPVAEQLAPEKNVISRRALNLLSPIGLGCVGGFIGGVIWCSAVTAIHVEIGIFALPMAYLIGWGVTAGSLRRGLLPLLLAVFITLGAWAVCIAIISHLGLSITPMEIPFLLAALVAAIMPTRSMKRERWERR